MKEEKLSRLIVMMRQAYTQRNAKYTVGGNLRKYPPKKVTLPKLKCLENKEWNQEKE